MQLIINGCNGKMGQVLSQIASVKNKIVCGISQEIDNTKQFPVYDDIFKFNGDADVLIDFSIATAVPKIIDYCTQKKIPAVICTTGIDNTTQKKIEYSAKIIPIMQSANMSIGINIINLILERISKVLFDMNFDIEILEKHHNKKIDSPSGTALLLADTINKSLENKLEYSFDRNHQRQKNELGISCIRGGTIVGEHSIIFAGPNENIEIKHTAYSREIFAIGALKAAEFIINKPNGLYSMKDLFGDIL